MVQLRLFASARVAAGTAHEAIPGDTVDEVLATAVTRFGSEFAAILNNCRVWVNGQTVSGETAVEDSDEVAILPPVSGGEL